MVVFTCQGIFWLEKQGLAKRLGTEGEAAAAIFENQLTV